MRSCTKALWAVVVLATLPATGRADEADSYTTVVTASRDEEEEFASPSSISVAGEEDLEGARTVPESIEALPGVYVQKTSPAGGSPILHGLMGFHTLLLVDGVRLNNSTWRAGPVQYMNLVDPWSVSSIEVLKGPGSVLYGSDAMGGVVQVITTDPTVPLAAPPYIDPLAGMRYFQASHGLSLHAGASGGAGPAAMWVGAGGKWFGPIAGGGGVGSQTFTGYDERDGGAKLRWSPAAGHVLTLAWFHVEVVDAGRADQLLSDDRVRWYDNLGEILYLRHDVAAGIVSWQTILSWQRGTERSRDLRLDPGWETWHRENVQETKVHTLGATTAGHILLARDRLKLSLGAEYTIDLVDSDARERSSTLAPYSEALAPLPAGSRFFGLGGFALLHYYQKGAGSDGFHAFAGGRVSWFSSHAPARLGLEAVDFDVVSPVACAGAQVVLGTHLSASIQYLQGFRAPSLSQTAISGVTGPQYEVPNPDLGPERSHTFEHNAKLEAGPLSIRTSVFASILTDLIVRESTGEEYDGLPVYRNVNSEKGLVLGAEAWLRIRLPAGFFLSGQVSYTHGDSWLHDVREPLSRIPPLFGAALVGWEHPNGWFFSEIALRGASRQERLSSKDKEDPRIPENGTPGWVTLDARAGWRFHDRLKVGIEIENLLDVKYRIHGSGIWEPGLSASVWLIVSPWR